MNREQVESQLSAMYDGELPAAECELLARRLVREEPLRAAWSRYAMIGAALRAEPQTRVRPDFARRVSQRLDAAAQASLATRRRRQFLRRAGLGMGLAAGVAGVALLVLRDGVLPSAAGAPQVAAVAPAPQAAPALVAASAPLPSLRAGRGAWSSLDLAAGGEPASYVVPPSGPASGTAVPASLAGYVLAHSEVSSPLARRSLISSLVASEALPLAAEPAPPAAAGPAGTAAAPAAGDAPR